MGKRTLLELANDVCTGRDLVYLDALELTTNTSAAKILSCINRAAEELTMEYDWEEQLAQCTFTADHIFGWDYNLKGYDLQTITGGKFKKFTTNYLYDVNNKRVIKEIMPDEKITREVSGIASGGTTRFIRVGDTMIFSPDLPLGTVVTFYYQMPYYAYTYDVAGNKQYADRLLHDSDYFVMDDGLLVRAAAVKYYMAVGFDSSREEQVLADYKAQAKAIHSPSGIIRYYEGMLGLPLYGDGVLM
ncbi:hypothetical protein AGMMS49573_09410 [Endomicrobiia bacterium]|nr:hypothetical protein AGMMS49573_09410 [Endomicrobiia bacterium]